MKISISMASKTFLLGEYSVLTGGGALLAATSPRFRLEVMTNGGGECEGIHPHSPAGQWIRSNNALFQNCQIRFFDPHQGKGGLGASSAQFLAAYTWSIMAQHLPTEWPNQLLPQEAWRAYRLITSASEQERWAPSGADVVAQWMGGLSVFRSQPFSVQRLTWPLTHLAFSFFRTHVKVATHQHLTTLQDVTHFELGLLAEKGLDALEKGNEVDFISAIGDFGQLLEKKSLLHHQVQPMIRRLRESEIVLATKGCGALGADVIVIFHRPENQAEVIELARSLNLTFESGLADLDHGLQIEVSPSLEGEFLPREANSAFTPVEVEQ